MSIAQSLLAEFESEVQITRKFLERLPPDKLAWRPHEKSHTAGELAYHLAVVPGFVAKFMLVDASPVPVGNLLFVQPQSVPEILALLDQSIETVRAILPTLDDALLMTNWSATLEGKVVATMPKAAVLRVIMLNHWIQHRGQFGVYLRLTGAKVPSSYGPSGDEG